VRSQPPSAAFTIAQVAARLGVNEDLLHEISIDMFPEHGCMWIYDIDREIPAFTDYGIEHLEFELEQYHGWKPADHPNRRPYGVRNSDAGMPPPEIID
jgi:hypothetical protein